jgi:hypothetical protein
LHGAQYVHSLIGNCNGIAADPLVRSFIIGFDRYIGRWRKVSKRFASQDLEQPWPCQRTVAQLIHVSPREFEAILDNVFGQHATARQRPRAAEQEAIVVADPGVVEAFSGTEHGLADG